MKPKIAGKMLTGKDSERFWSKVDVGGKASCWPWLACQHKFGYGVFGMKSKRFTAHRISYMDCVGDIPEGLLLRHKCDNPACCNPHHLEVGTQKNNMDDAVLRGRMDRTAYHRNRWLSLLKAPAIAKQ